MDLSEAYTSVLTIFYIFGLFQCALHLTFIMQKTFLWVTGGIWWVLGGKEVTEYIILWNMQCKLRVKLSYLPACLDGDSWPFYHLIQSYRF